MFRHGPASDTTTLRLKPVLPFVYQICSCLHKTLLMNAFCFVYVDQPLRWRGRSREALQYILFCHETLTIATDAMGTNTVSAPCTCLISKALVHWIELQSLATDQTHI